MEEETRDQRYLRILTQGISGKEDHEDARYLIDKGYLDGRYRISKMKDSYGQPLNLVVIGLKPAGVDFVEELRARADLDNTQLGRDQQPDSEASRLAKNIPPIEVKIVDDRSHIVRLLSGVKGVFVAVLTAVLAAIAFLCIKIFWGIDL